MNLKRSLSRHQHYFLREIASERIVYILNRGVYCSGGYQVFKPGYSKYLGVRFGNHEQNSLIELYQRRLLIDSNGRLVPSPQAAKQFGSPPETPAPKREILMSRTRAARVV